MNRLRTSNHEIMDAVAKGLADIPTSQIVREMTCTDKTVFNWKSKRSAPRAAELLDLIIRFPSVKRQIDLLSKTSHESPPHDVRLSISRMARI